MKACAHPTCHTIVPSGRCATHARVQDQGRGTAQERGYDSPWNTYAKRWRARYPVCGMRHDGQLYSQHSLCVQAGLTTPVQCVDHIHPMSRGGDKWNSANHQSLCHRCNTVKGDK